MECSSASVPDLKFGNKTARTVVPRVQGGCDGQSRRTSHYSRRHQSKRAARYSSHGIDFCWSALSARGRPVWPRLWRRRPASRFMWCATRGSSADISARQRPASSVSSTTCGRRLASCSSTSSMLSARERGDLHETGEIKRVVTSLLMQMDDLPSYTVIAAATNHPELLDRASWRAAGIAGAGWMSVVGSSWATPSSTRWSPGETAIASALARARIGSTAHIRSVWSVQCNTYRYPASQSA